MNSKEKELVEQIKSNLLAELDEWVGSDVPEEGTEDHDTWRSRLEAIEGIDNISDVYAYAEGYARDRDEFLAEWGL